MSTVPKFSLFFCLLCMVVFTTDAGVYHIRNGTGLASIKIGMTMAMDYDTLYIHKGLYLENLIEIDKPLVIIGIDHPVIDSEGGEEIFIVTSDEVVIRGLTFKNIGVSFLKDHAAIKLIEVKNVIIEDNFLVNAFFGIYLQNSQDCIVRSNTITGEAKDEVNAGNAIHIWKGRRIEVMNNELSHHRDGIYFEFVDESIIKGNVSKNNMRYGLHFMFSNYDIYENNIFDNNGAGVAVMFSNHIKMINNEFTENWGGASYGILLKEISNGQITNNLFNRNTVGVYAEGANNLMIERNEFLSNGKAMDIKGNCTGNEILSNNFINNTFEVLTNSRSNLNHFEGNYWGQYAGYDLDKDGIGDVAHRPVNLFALITDKIPAANMLLHSFLVHALDGAERLYPQMIPEHLIDERPKMKPMNYD